MTAHDAAALETLAARAWDAWLQGHVTQARSLVRAASAAARQRPRRQRQQIQIVQLAVHSDWDRASGLAAEHLAEYPGDQLIRRLLGTVSAHRSRPLAAAEGLLSRRLARSKRPLRIPTEQPANLWLRAGKPASS